MDEKRFTPGPWKADERYEDSTEVVDSKGLSHVTAERCAILLGWDEHFEHWGDSKEAHRDISREEQRANARLIAAAPDLLEACLRLRNQLYAAGYDSKENSLNPTEDLLFQTEQAIAKALGKE